MNRPVRECIHRQCTRTRNRTIARTHSHTHTHRNTHAHQSTLGCEIVSRELPHSLRVWHQCSACKLRSYQRGCKVLFSSAYLGDLHACGCNSEPNTCTTQHSTRTRTPRSYVCVRISVGRTISAALNVNIGPLYDVMATQAVTKTTRVIHTRMHEHTHTHTPKHTRTHTHNISHMHIPSTRSLAYYV